MDEWIWLVIRYLREIVDYICKQQYVSRTTCILLATPILSVRILIMCHKKFGVSYFDWIN